MSPLPVLANMVFLNGPTHLRTKDSFSHRTKIESISLSLFHSLSLSLSLSSLSLSLSRFYWKTPVTDKSFVTLLILLLFLLHFSSHILLFTVHLFLLFVSVCIVASSTYVSYYFPSVDLSAESEIYFCCSFRQQVTTKCLNPK
jgi:hypothetical protein